MNNIVLPFFRERVQTDAKLGEDKKTAFQIRKKLVSI